MAEFILKALIKARQVTGADYNRFDRIICMDSSNLRLIKRFFPDDPNGKIHLMMSYTGVGRDVADPWYTGDFETTFQDLLEACECMVSNCTPGVAHREIVVGGRGEEQEGEIPKSQGLTWVYV